jgi:hypothetical protein
MAQAELDTSQGWCCDGRTYKEHADADGECCQPQGKQIEDSRPRASRRLANDWPRQTDSPRQGRSPGDREDDLCPEPPSTLDPPGREAPPLPARDDAAPVPVMNGQSRLARRANGP